ncbi:hypothetical protein H5407_12020 [Mitsuaria sp. WAJ17]|nr:MaoC/PaaZ C-terminal domain-containing protein [Mitsuaria sp. WAJ17]MBB2485947.1 hypothetical protein [Mitsuaria sp. WAJ17]
MNVQTDRQPAPAGSSQRAKQDLTPAANAARREADPTTQLSQNLASLRQAAARLPVPGGFPGRARLLLQLCEQLQQHRESLMHAGWLAGYAPWDQHLDFDAGLAAVRQLAQELAKEWSDAALVVDGEPQSLDREGRYWAAQALTRAEGVDVLVLGLHRPCAHLLLGFSSAWLAGRACLVLCPEEHPLLEALMLALRRGLPHGGAVLRSMVGVDLGLALAQLQATDHLQVWSTPESTDRAEMRWEQLPGCAAERLLQLAAPGLAVLDASVEPGGPQWQRLVDLVALGVLALQGLHEHAVRMVWLPREQLGAFHQALQQRWLAWQGCHPARHWQGGADAVQRLRAQAWVQDALARGAQGLPGDPQGPSVVQLRQPAGGEGPGLAPPPLGPVLALWAYDDVADLDAALQALSKGCRGGLAVLASEEPEHRRAWSEPLARHHRFLHLLDARPTQPADHEQTLRGAWELLAALDRSTVRVTLKSLLQPCTVLAEPVPLGECLQQYLPGAARRELDVHPFRRCFEDLAVGDSLLTHRRTVTEADIAAFGGVSGDYFYMHFDAEAAAASPFGRRIAHGYFVLSAAAGLFVWPGEGPVLANYGLDRLRFIQPVGIGDTIQARLTCKRKQDKPQAGSRRGQGVVVWDVQVTNQQGETVLSYDILTLVAKRPREATATA